MADVHFTPESHFDFILVGAGGAGMCLLDVLLNRGLLNDKRLLILDPDPKRDNNRTWCFWAQPEEEIAVGPGSRACPVWTHAASGGRVQPIAPYKYYHLRSADFYSAVKNRLMKMPNLTWLPIRVAEVEQRDDAVLVEAEGQWFTGGMVFDSRLTPRQIEILRNDPEMLWQSFYGLRIKLVEGAFEATTPRLMDFEVPQSESVQFIYFLPVSRNEALVELTRFGVLPIDEASAIPVLEEWIKTRFGAFEWEEIEFGMIPMTQRLDAALTEHEPGAKIIPIGTAAGAVKGSTGYAFKAMYRHAEGIATALEQHKPIPTPFRARRFAFYDALLLDILRKRPHWGKRIFEQLFLRVPLPRVLEFLEERTGLRKEIPILLSLPAIPFLQAFAERHITPPNRREIVLEFAPAIVAWALVLLSGFTQQWLIFAGGPLLILGMIFPGIPHGALDHYIGPEGQLKGLKLLKFVFFYLLFMALVLLIWQASPVLGVSLFLLYSAWHFGETDMRHWGAFRISSAWLQGIFALGFILCTHPAEWQAYLLALGFPASFSFPAQILEISGVICGAGLLGLGVFVPRKSGLSWLNTIAVLAAGIFLPLIPAFALYFIGIHSVRGWMHLRKGLGVGTWSLMKQALPFSMGAYLLFILLLVFDRYFGLSFEGMIPGMFMFLAALSAPHILQMHRYYNHREASDI
jgi:lycopene beta-cyclase